MASANVTNTTPWTQYYCNKDTVCEPGFECHVNKYCIPQLKEGETCVDEKDDVAPFVARVDNVYHLYCDMPTTDFKPQNITCPLGCESKFLLLLVHISHHFNAFDILDKRINWSIT
jgi:hypothetical protein